MPSLSVKFQGVGMLICALISFIISLIAALFDFSGAIVTSVDLSQTLFYFFFVLSFLLYTMSTSFFFLR